MKTVGQLWMRINTLVITGTVTKVGDGFVANSTRTIVPNYTTPAATVGASEANPLAVAEPVVPVNAVTRNSASFITDTNANDHLVVIKSGGTVWDAYNLQKNQPSGIADWTAFKVAISASNPNIADLNAVAPGTALYMPVKLTDGSITYHVSNGASINVNKASGEYHMVIPDGNGGHITYSRKLEPNGLGGEGYIVRESQVGSNGSTNYEFEGRQANLQADVAAFKSITKIDADHNGIFESIQTLDKDAAGICSREDYSVSPLGLPSTASYTFKAGFDSEITSKDVLSLSGNGLSTQITSLFDAQSHITVANSALASTADLLSRTTTAQQANGTYTQDAWHYNAAGTTTGHHLAHLRAYKSMMISPPMTQADKQMYPPPSRQMAARWCMVMTTAKNTG